MSEARDIPSLHEVHRTVPIPEGGNWLRRMFAFAGPAYLVSVGYMDPGNWATDLQGGARFGYQLVWVLLMSNLMAVLLQTLSARLGVVTGKDLAQACRDWYPHVLVWPLWIICEIAIVACDLAEVLGAAIGLHLLFGLPLLWGVLITAADVLLLLALSRLGMRRMEAFIIVLVVTIGGCFAMEMILSRPDIPDILRHFIPRDTTGRPSLFQAGPGGVRVLGLDQTSLYIAMGILGATVMPHNLYLHSALVQTRAVEQSSKGKREASRLNLIDSVVALNAAFFVNLAILVLAAATFHTRGHTDVARLEDAHRLLTPLLGSALAATLFAVALLCSGQSSTITGTLAGQIVMEGFIRIRIRPWLRRLISRGLAIIPAVLVIVWKGPNAVDDLLVLSQVVLSMQLSFAVIPLITFTSDRRKMGEFANPPWVVVLAVIASVLILGLNMNLVVQQVGDWFRAAGGNAIWLAAALLPIAIVLGGTLAYITLAPLVQRLWPRLAPMLAPERGPVTIGSGPPVTEPPIPSPALAPSFDRARLAELRRIAVALEMGGGDAAVLEFVRTIPPRPDSEILLVHVVESAAGRYLGRETSDEETRADERALDAIARSLGGQGLRTRAVLGHGDPADELTRLVAEEGAELLIVGAHGHRMLGDLFYGATTSRLRHRVKCPVLIVPASERSTAPRA
jgi:manganese transport protein